MGGEPGGVEIAEHPLQFNRLALSAAVLAGHNAERWELTISEVAGEPLEGTLLCRHCCRRKI